MEIRLSVTCLIHRNDLTVPAEEEKNAESCCQGSAFYVVHGGGDQLASVFDSFDKLS